MMEDPEIESLYNLILIFEYIIVPYNSRKLDSLQLLINPTTIYDYINNSIKIIKNSKIITSVKQNKINIDSINFDIENISSLINKPNYAYLSLVSLLDDIRNKRGKAPYFREIQLLCIDMLTDIISYKINISGFFYFPILHNSLEFINIFTQGNHPFIITSEYIFKHKNNDKVNNYILPATPVPMATPVPIGNPNQAQNHKKPKPLSIFRFFGGSKKKNSKKKKSIKKKNSKKKKSIKKKNSKKKNSKKKH